jgi:uncharacterized RDD family membrane protein YckC
MEYDDVLTIPTPEGVELHLTLAGPGSRFVSALLDILIQFLVLLCIGLILGVSGAVGFGKGGIAVLVWFILSFSVITFYDVFFEVFRSGQTPGKRVNGLRVVRVGGHPVTFLTSAIRNFLRVIDFLPSAYLLGACVILATRKNQRIGDVVAGTVVVRTGRKPIVVEYRSPPAQLAIDEPAWDTSRISDEELAVVRHFLERRRGLDQTVRAQIAGTLAERLRPKVTGAPADTRGEVFLAKLVAAKVRRGG